VADNRVLMPVYRIITPFYATILHVSYVAGELFRNSRLTLLTSLRRTHRSDSVAPCLLRSVYIPHSLEHSVGCHQHPCPGQCPGCSVQHPARSRHVGRTHCPPYKARADNVDNIRRPVPEGVVNPVHPRATSLVVMIHTSSAFEPRIAIHAVEPGVATENTLLVRIV